MSDRQIITRRNLPHWYVPGAVHFVTYRLAGTMPREVLQRLRAERDARLRQKPPGLTPVEILEDAHKRFFGDYDRYLDRTCKLDWLARPGIAAIVRRNLYHHNGSKYHLLAYCIMSNHVHVLLQPTAPVEVETHVEGDEVEDARGPLSRIMHSLKSYTANEANRILRRTGAFWQRESYDHWVRDDDELERIVEYIAGNPVKAGLGDEPHGWFFCSAHDRFLHDGECCGWLPFPAVR